MPNIIALLTDFGEEDIYVGVMKATMLGICRSAQIVDITHAIHAQHVREAAFALLNSYQFFPKGTTFCVVVDPGVGSTRLPVAVKTDSYYFVAPDNGVLSYALAHQASEYQAVKLENTAFQASQISHTFHGRDIFAPAAAHLANDPGVFHRLGAVLDRIEVFPDPLLEFGRQRLTGEVMHIDHFGNIITSIGAFSWVSDLALTLAPVWSRAIPRQELNAKAAHITIHSHTIHGISHAYHEVAEGAIIAQIDSNGFLEIGANQENAATRLDVELGDKVMLRLAE